MKSDYAVVSCEEDIEKIAKELGITKEALSNKVKSLHVYGGTIGNADAIVVQPLNA